MVKKILVVLAALVLLLVIVIATRPADFTYARKATMAASPSEVFPHVNDFRKWNAWSPWAKLDPEAKYSFEGPEAGVGAKFSWAGNSKIGAGTNEILESVPGEKVRVKLHFEKPFEAISEAVFDLKPTGEETEETEVTWTMTGKNDFMGKAFDLFVDIDEMIGRDFEEGLANLKKILEASPASGVEPPADRPTE